MKKRFKRQQFWLKRLGERWRRPRGKQSKLRKEKGGRKRVKVGFRTPKMIRGMLKTHEGAKPFVYVRSIADLANVDKEKEVAIISSSIGKKKYLEIVKRARELGIKIFNKRKTLLPEIKKLLKEKETEKDNA